MEKLYFKARKTAKGMKTKEFISKLAAQMDIFSQTNCALSEDRMAQELAILINKSDITEELDRLFAHFKACKELLVSSVPIGRRLDFICQEINREVNTMCAKSGDLVLTSIGIDMKVEIEKFREQIQNIQ